MRRRQAVYLVMSGIGSLNLISALGSEHKLERQTNRDAWYFTQCGNPGSNRSLLSYSGSCGYPVTLETQDFNLFFIINLVNRIILIFINFWDIFFTEKYFNLFLVFITALAVINLAFSLHNDFWNQATLLPVQKIIWTRSTFRSC